MALVLPRPPWANFACRIRLCMLRRMSRRKVSTTIYITDEQNVELKRLHDITKVPVAEYIRQGIDIILERHRQVLSPQRQLDFESLLLAKRD